MGNNSNKFDEVTSGVTSLVFYYYGSCVIEVETHTNVYCVHYLYIHNMTL